MKNSKRKAIRSGEFLRHEDGKAVRGDKIPAVPFKVAAHLGVLRGKLARKEITADALPELLALGQNGGGPTRKERRLPKRLAAKVAQKAANKGRMAR
jgi:hypothetical protein